MSLDARKSLLWIRLQNRFKASQTLNKEIPRVIESVQPVTNVDSLLQQPRIKTKTLIITSTGTKDFGKIEDMLPVVAGKRHTLLGYQITTTAVATFTQIYLYDPITGNVITLDTFTAAVGRNAIFPQQLPVDPNWTVSVNVNAYTSTGDLVIMLYVIEEDAF